MFRITRDPSSGSFIKCLAKITVTVLSRLSRQRSTHTHHGQICCHNTDYVHANGHDITITVILAKHCIKLPDDASLVIRNMLEHF
jgi:hypothetical protein